MVLRKSGGDKQRKQTEGNIALDQARDVAWHCHVFPPYPRVQLAIHIKVEMGAAAGLALLFEDRVLQQKGWLQYK